MSWPLFFTSNFWLICPCLFLQARQKLVCLGVSQKTLDLVCCPECFFIYYLYLIVLFLNAKTDPMIQLSWVQEAEHNTEAVRGNVPHTLALLLGKFPIQKDLWQSHRKVICDITVIYIMDAAARESSWLHLKLCQLGKEIQPSRNPCNTKLTSR